MAPSQQIDMQLVEAVLVELKLLAVLQKFPEYFSRLVLSELQSHVGR